MALVGKVDITETFFFENEVEYAPAPEGQTTEVITNAHANYRTIEEAYIMIKEYRIIHQGSQDSRTGYMELTVAIYDSKEARNEDPDTYGVKSYVFTNGEINIDNQMIRIKQQVYNHLMTLPEFANTQKD